MSSSMYFSNLFDEVDSTSAAPGDPENRLIDQQHQPHTLQMAPPSNPKADPQPAHSSNSLSKPLSQPEHDPRLVQTNPIQHPAHPIPDSHTNPDRPSPKLPMLDDSHAATCPETPPVQEDDDDDQEDDDDVDDDEPHTTSAPRVEAGRKRKQELHRRHSKRYRDNLGDLFHSLETLLPKVIPGCKLKTKSQIIANSVEAVMRLRSEVSSLEMQYVLSSSANRTKWVEDTVSNAASFHDVAEPFMRLLVGMQRWKHSELWGRFETSILPDGSASATPVPTPTNSIHDLGPISSRNFFLKLLKTASAHDMVATAVPESYKSFSRLSQLQTFIAGDESLVGHIATSLSPKWIDLTDSDACSGFKRADAARQCGFTVCFAVPFLVRGHVFATVLFFDDQQRSDIAPDISIAQDLASSLGNCYGASNIREPACNAVPKVKP